MSLLLQRESTPERFVEPMLTRQPVADDDGRGVIQYTMRSSGADLTRFRELLSGPFRHRLLKRAASA